MSRAASRFVLWAGAALTLLGFVVGPPASANYVDFFFTLPPYAPVYDDQVDEPIGTASATARFTGYFPTVMPGATPSQGFYVDAQSSYARVVGGVPYDGAQPTPYPEQRSSVVLDVIGYNNGAGPFPPFLSASTGSKLTQSVIGSYAGAATSAPAHVEFDIDVDFSIQPDTVNPATDFIGEFGLLFQPPPPAGLQAFQVSFDQAGPGPGPTIAGLALIDLGGGNFRAIGTVRTSPFTATTTGTPFTYDSTFFVASSAAPYPTPGLFAGRVEVNGGNTVVARIVSDDPNASFALPIPSPEPGTTLLVAVAIAALVAQLRGRR